MVLGAKSKPIAFYRHAVPGVSLTSKKRSELLQGQSLDFFIFEGKADLTSSHQLLDLILGELPLFVDPPLYPNPRTELPAPVRRRHIRIAVAAPVLGELRESLVPRRYVRLGGPVYPESLLRRERVDRNE